MPVLVFAADAPLGRRITLRLLAEGGEVRAYASGDGEVASLRAAGAFVASGDPDDEGLLDAALAEVHTVVDAREQLLAIDPEHLVVASRTLAVAAANAGVRRVIALSLPGAAPDADDGLRRALGTAERILADAAVPTVVLRTSLLDTPELRDALATVRPGQEAREQTVAPLRVDDLVELVVAFDALRSRAAEGHVVFRADGPETMTLDDYLRRAGVEGASLIGRRYADPGTRRLLVAALAAGPWRVADPAVPDAWSFAGLRPTVVDRDRAL